VDKRSQSWPFVEFQKIWGFWMVDTRSLLPPKTLTVVTSMHILDPLPALYTTYTLKTDNRYAGLISETLVDGDS
jgi:hypothetical protein